MIVHSFFDYYASLQGGVHTFFKKWFKTIFNSEFGKQVTGQIFLFGIERKGIVCDNYPFINKYEGDNQYVFPFLDSTSFLVFVISPSCHCSVLCKEVVLDPERHGELHLQIIFLRRCRFYYQKEHQLYYVAEDFAVRFSLSMPVQHCCSFEEFRV